METTKELVAVFVGFQILMQVVLKGTKGKLWSMFYAFQMLAYLRIFEVPIPANLDLFLNEMTKLVEFEMLNVNFILSMIWPDFDLKAWLNGGLRNFKNPDQDVSVLDDLNVYIMFLVIFVAIVVLLIILVVMLPCLRQKIKDLLLKIKGMVMFNMLI